MTNDLSEIKLSQIATAASVSSLLTRATAMESKIETASGMHLSLAQRVLYLEQNTVALDDFKQVKSIALECKDRINKMGLAS